MVDWVETRVSTHKIFSSIANGSKQDFSRWWRHGTNRHNNYPYYLVLIVIVIPTTFYFYYIKIFYIF